MGLFDSVIGAATNALQGGTQNPPAGASGALGALLPQVTQLLTDNQPGGGLAWLVDKFKQAGLGDLVASWIGKGENLPVSADQIRNVLGSEQIGQLASQVGIDPAQVSEHLSQLLPGLVDKLTPEGHLPEGGLADAGALLGQLGGLFGSRGGSGPA